MNRDKKAQPDQGIGRGLARIAEAIRHHASTRRPATQEELRDREHKHRVEWFALAVAGIGIVINTLMWLSTRDAVNLTRAQIQLARDAAHTEQRAYVLVENLVIGERRAEPQPVFANVNFKNVGQTPALNVRSSCVGRVRRSTDGEPPVIEPYLTITPGTGSVSDVGPNQEALECSAFLDELQSTHDSLQFARVLSGDDRFFVITVINYWDVFDDPADRPHYTRHCALYLPARKGFTPCASGNDVDKRAGHDEHRQ